MKKLFLLLAVFTCINLASASNCYLWGVDSIQFYSPDANLNVPFAGYYDHAGVCSSGARTIDKESCYYTFHSCPKASPDNCLYQCNNRLNNLAKCDLCGLKLIKSVLKCESITDIKECENSYYCGDNGCASCIVKGSSCASIDSGISSTGKKCTTGSFTKFCKECVVDSDCQARRGDPSDTSKFWKCENNTCMLSCQERCREEDFADTVNRKQNLRMQIGSQTYNLAGLSGIYTGGKGNTLIILTYIKRGDINSYAIISVKDFFGRYKHYAYVSKCKLIKPGESYSAREIKSPQLSSSDLTDDLVPNGKTITFSILDHPCPQQECETSNDCNPNGKCHVCKKDDPAKKGICTRLKEECCDGNNVNPVKNFPEKGCSFCDGSKAAYSEKTEGGECRTENDKQGVCRKENNKMICKEATCESVYGAGYQKCCPDSRINSPDALDCCKKDAKCCYLNKKADPVCCDSEFYDSCAQVAVGDLKNTNLCHLNKCPDSLPKKCPAPTDDPGKGITSPFCCRQDEECSVQDFLSIVRAPACVKTQCDEIQGETVCKGSASINKINGKDATLCCKQGEYCADVSGKGIFKLCLPTLESCQAPKILCSGIREFEGKIGFCCNEGKMCMWSPNGFPICIPMPGKQIDTGTKTAITGSVISASEILSQISIQTNEAGYYLLRDEKNLTERGEAVHVYLQSGELNEYVSYIISNLKNLRLYKYSEKSLADCSSGVKTRDTAFTSSGKLVYIDYVDISCDYVKENQIMDMILLANSLSDNSQGLISVKEAISSIKSWRENKMKMQDLISKIREFKKSA